MFLCFLCVQIAGMWLSVSWLFSSLCWELLWLSPSRGKLCWACCFSVKGTQLRSSGENSVICLAEKNCSMKKLCSSEMESLFFVTERRTVQSADLQPQTSLLRWTHLRLALLRLCHTPPPSLKSPPWIRRLRLTAAPQTPRCMLGIFLSQAFRPTPNGNAAQVHTSPFSTRLKWRFYTNGVSFKSN